MKETSVIMGNEKPVRRYQFEPMGVNHELQELITDLMHKIVLREGKYTLAEMGYLHMSSVAFVNDHVEVKVFFAPELSTATGSLVNGKATAEPNPILNVFKNYLFVGSLDANVSFSNMRVPKYYIDRDERDQLAIRIKDKKNKNADDTEVMVLYCNLDLILAAYYDANLLDPDFNVSCETIGNSSKNNEETPGIMISMGASQEFPVRVMATIPVASDGYETTDAIPYLIGKMQAKKEAKKTKKELARKVSNSAEEMVKKNDKKLNAWKKFR